MFYIYMYVFYIYICFIYIDNVIRLIRIEKKKKDILEEFIAKRDQKIIKMSGLELFIEIKIIHNRNKYK